MELLWSSTVASMASCTFPSCHMNRLVTSSFSLFWIGAFCLHIFVSDCPITWRPTWPLFFFKITWHVATNIKGGKTSGLGNRLKVKIGTSCIGWLHQHACWVTLKPLELFLLFGPLEIIITWNNLFISKWVKFASNIFQVLLSLLYNGTYMFVISLTSWLIFFRYPKFQTWFQLGRNFL